ncbi:MAG: hypothetical protein ACPL4E_06325 [Thermoproteota archaeon]
MPYSSGQLTVNLYPLTGVNGLVKISTLSRFTIQFWTALVSGAFCLAGWVLRQKEVGTKSSQLPPPKPIGFPGGIRNAFKVEACKTCECGAGNAVRRKSPPALAETPSPSGRESALN